MMTLVQDSAAIKTDVSEYLVTLQNSLNVRLEKAGYKIIHFV